MSLCSCAVSLQNTGSPSCAPIMGVAANFILVPLIANDGTFNYIDPTATLNDAYFTALINEADESKRWYPTGKLKNVTTDRADPILETFEDGSSVFIRDGIRNFTAMIIKGSFELAKQYLQQGANVTIVARNVARLETAAKALENSKVNQSQKISTIAVDVSSTESAVKNAFAPIISSIGAVDVIINSAGYQVFPFIIVTSILYKHMILTVHCPRFVQDIHRWRI